MTSLLGSNAAGWLKLPLLVPGTGSWEKMNSTQVSLQGTSTMNTKGIKRRWNAQTSMMDAARSMKITDMFLKEGPWWLYDAVRPQLLDRFARTMKGWYNAGTEVVATQDYWLPVQGTVLLQKTVPVTFNEAVAFAISGTSMNASPGIVTLQFTWYDDNGVQLNQVTSEHDVVASTSRAPSRISMTDWPLPGATMVEIGVVSVGAFVSDAAVGPVVAPPAWHSVLFDSMDETYHNSKISSFVLSLREV